MTKTQRPAPESREHGRERSPYSSPRLEVLGSLRSATMGTGGTQGDGANTMTMRKSDRRVKEGIERVGQHPLGLGVYVFSYRAPFDEIYGSGRQVGFMADEVAAKYPDAVSTGADGYLRVDYGRLLQ